MTDANNPNKPNRPLSEISHLFLSSLREQAGENRTRPVRIPPGSQRPMTPAQESLDTNGLASHPSVRRETDVDLTPEEFARVFGSPAERTLDAAADGEAEAETVTQRKRVTAIIGGHLTGNLNEAVLAYAASLSASGQRIGLMSLEGNAFKLQLVECEDDGLGEPADQPDASERFEGRRMSDALLELNHDVDRWLLVLADPRRIESRGLLRRADDWTMLCTCDHDGIVSGYRTLKGLAEGEKAPLSIALIDAPSETQAEKVFGKLAAVCRQFLDWDVEHDVLLADVEHAQVHTVLWCHTAETSNNAPQHRVIETFLELAPDAKADAAHYGKQRAQLTAPAELEDEAAVANQPMSIPTIARPLESMAASTQTPASIEMDAIPAVADDAIVHQAVANQPTVVPIPIQNLPPQPIESSSMNNNPMKITATITAQQDEIGEVVELPEGASILSAVLKSGTQLIATPITPPMCGGATVAIGRDRGLVLVAQAESGLAGMESIAHAVRWLDDSKQLIAMAMPQLAIDAAAPTRVQLLIDHNDRTAEGIRPLLGDSRITIRSYRKLRWAGRTGLLLDAA